MTQPTCTIIAGPNGAGKATFALTYLPDAANGRNFVNADLIAAGLSPLSSEREWLAASRLFLREIDHYIQRREDLAFETTLSGKNYLRSIRELLADGWRVDLYYLWLPTIELPTIEMSIERVAECLSNGSPSVLHTAVMTFRANPLSGAIRAASPILWRTMRHCAVRPFASIIPRPFQR
jgi:predicted ABC-type ATPase